MEDRESNHNQYIDWDWTQTAGFERVPYLSSNATKRRESSMFSSGSQVLYLQGGDTRRTCYPPQHAERGHAIHVRHGASTRREAGPLRSAATAGSISHRANGLSVQRQPPTHRRAEPCWRWLTTEPRGRRQLLPPDGGSEPAAGRKHTTRRKERGEREREREGDLLGRPAFPFHQVLHPTLTHKHT